MRSATTVAIGLLASVAIGGMSGTYTIKPGGGGSFLTLDAAGEALDSLGMSGNCVFEIYGDTLLSPHFLPGDVPGSESWTCTFRPGSGQHPVLLAGTFYGFFDNVKIENLELRATQVMLSGVSGWRVSHCRFTYVDQWGVSMEECSKDTVDDNTLQVVPYADYGYSALSVSNGDSILLFNNIVNSDSCPVQALVRIEYSRGTRFVFNTLRQSLIYAPQSYTFLTGGGPPSEVRDNIFVLGLPSDSSDACVCVTGSAVDSILLDNNCYFVESRGHIGAAPIDPYHFDWAGWRGLGFEAHGINADPRFFSSTNLHVRSGSPCNTRATPIVGINYDIDGDPRDPTHPDMGADEIAGAAVEETPSAEVRTTNRRATIARGVLFLAEAPSRKPQATSLLDIGGRKVLDLKPGANDVRALAPGVYFVREAQAQAQAQAQTIRKVVITR
jgi:hypothetical protein